MYCSGKKYDFSLTSLIVLKQQFQILIIMIMDEYMY